MSKMKTIGLAAILVGFTSQTAWASGKTRSEKQVSQTSSSAARDRQALRQVRGEVLQVKSVKLRGSNLSNQIVLLKTRKGNDRLVIDLGAADRSIRLKRGDRISAEGRMLEIGDRRLMVARRMKVGDSMKELRIDRTAQREQVDRERRGG